ncbi:MAG: DUF1801 domain-containing protein [Marinilabiliales bacterium]|nr:DUF1801 domain-containing protein [Marinilabiliales bacterium]
MQSKATTVEVYLSELPADRQAPMRKLREVILSNLPAGFEETMSYGMIGYVVPHSLYPAGYHCTPKLPLPFINLASQKNFIVVYHMGIYANPALTDWFTTEYSRIFPSKPDVGKGCLRFKKPEQIPFDLIGQLVGKMTPADWIRQYEQSFKKPK